MDGLIENDNIQSPPSQLGGTILFLCRFQCEAHHLGPSQKVLPPKTPVRGSHVLQTTRLWGTASWTWLRRELLRELLSRIPLLTNILDRILFWLNLRFPGPSEIRKLKMAPQTHRSHVKDYIRGNISYLSNSD